MSVKSNAIGSTTFGLLAAALLGVVGCSHSKPQASPGRPAVAVSTYQQRILSASGTPTVAQYRAAFTAFESCAKSAGGRIKVTSQDSVSGLIGYASGSTLGDAGHPNLQTPEGRCYHEYFDSVEYAFDTKNPLVQQQNVAKELSTYRDLVRPCLLKNGRDAPATVTPGNADFEQLMTQWSELNGAGSCHG